MASSKISAAATQCGNRSGWICAACRHWLLDEFKLVISRTQHQGLIPSAMMRIVHTLFVLVGALFGSSNGQVEAPMEASVMPVNYTHDGADLTGYYSVPEGDGPFPAVVIIQ